MAWRALRTLRPLGGIHLAVIILLAATGLGGYVDQKNDDMHRQHREVSAGLERMVRLNYALTNTLTIALLEQNPLRAASFSTLNTQLDATMQEVQGQTAGLRMAPEVASLHKEQTFLRRVEQQAFALMRQDEWAGARQVLSGDDYRMALQLYEINSETVVGALSGELASLAKYHERLRQVSLVLRLAAVALLLWAGVRYSLRLQVELAEQVRLRGVIAAANEALEAKVRQRTAELEVANQRLEALSATDGLTGLANRRRFDAVWEAEWQRALRQGLSLGVIMLDIDHFKAYNDNHGHQAGDECLKRIAQVLQAAVRRAGELPARYGGEEFVVIVPGVEPEEALAAAERIRQAIQDEAMPHAASPVAEVVTASLGVAVGVPHAAQARRSLLERADAALYQAKHAGRNRVVMSTE